MKTSFRALLALTTLAVTGAVSPAFASDGEPLHVTVPFAFKAGKTLLPAGDYTVYSDDSRVVIVKGAHGSAILLGSAGPDVAGDKSGVSFERDSTGYCLKSIHSYGKVSSTVLMEGHANYDK